MRVSTKTIYMHRCWRNRSGATDLWTDWNGEWARDYIKRSGVMPRGVNVGKGARK